MHKQPSGVIVPHQIPHGIMGILQFPVEVLVMFLPRARGQSLELVNLKAIKTKMRLLAHDMGAAESAPTQIGRD